MTKEEIKPTVDEMIKNVLKYMSEALEDDKEFYELSVECAATFMISDVNIDDNMQNITHDLVHKNSDLICVMMGGILEYKKGKRGKTVI